MAVLSISHIVAMAYILSAAKARAADFVQTQLLDQRAEHHAATFEVPIYNNFSAQVRRNFALPGYGLTS